MRYALRDSLYEAPRYLNRPHRQHEEDSKEQLAFDIGHCPCRPLVGYQREVCGNPAVEEGQHEKD